MLRALPEWREVSRHVARGAWAAAEAPLLRVEALARQFAVEELPLVLALRGAGSFHRGHFAAAADAWSEVDSDAARHLARWARAEGSDVAEDLGQAPAGGAEADGQDDAGFGAAAVPASWADRVRFERRIVQALERAEYALDRGEEVDETALQQALKAAEASAAAAPQPLDATLYTPLLPRVLTSVARVYAARLQPIQAEGVLRSAIDMSAGEGARARRLRRHAAFHLAALFGKWEGREREVPALGELDERRAPWLDPAPALPLWEALEASLAS